MGRLSRGHLIEGVIFLLIVVVFYGFSFEFNRPIEIYRFGATAWPRTVIFLLLLLYSMRLVNLVRLYPDLPEPDEDDPSPRRRLFK